VIDALQSIIQGSGPPSEKLAALEAALAIDPNEDFIWDAEERFQVGEINTQESAICRSGEVLQGLIKPHECAAFGKECTPRNPLGATMVSSEGACAAYYLYRRLQVPPPSERVPVGAGAKEEAR